MTRQTLSTGSAANDGTGDTLRAAANKINDNFVELYQYLANDSDNLPTSFSFDSNGFIFEGENADSFSTTLIAVEPTAVNTVSVPNATTTLVGQNTTDTLTNKTLTEPVISTISNTGTLTLPTSTDTLVGRATTDTLTNKTLTSPTITTPTINTHIKDTNGATLLTTTAGTSAVNHIDIVNFGFTSATQFDEGKGPKFSVDGSQTDVNLQLASKGLGAVHVNKIAYETVEMNQTGTVDKTATFIQFDNAVNMSVTLADGEVIGEIKIFTNKALGTATVIPTNFAQGTSFAVSQNGSAQCIWDGNNWFMIGGSATANGLLATTT